MTIDLYYGRWEDVLADVDVDHVITDPPYGSRTHTGHNAGVDHTLTGNSGHHRSETTRRRKIDYQAWTPDDVDRFVDHWHARTSGWICAMSCSDLFPAWRAAFDRAGRVSFAPVACVIRAMSVRLSGDGPASWVVYLNVARPRGKQWTKWGALNGAYVCKRAHDRQRIGGKPLELINAIVRDYSRVGDLVCDPCAGYATTAIAAEQNGRNFVGAEVDGDTYRQALARISAPSQNDLFSAV